MSDSIPISGAFSNPFLIMYPSFTEPLTIFCNNAFSVTKDRISKDTELKREHILAFILTFISGWKKLSPLETLVPPFILGKSMLSDISTASSLAVLPRMEAFTLEFLSAPNIPTFMTVLFLEMLRQLVSNLTEGAAFPPQSKLPGFLALMLGDGRRRVASIVQDVLGVILRSEVEVLDNTIETAADETSSDADTHSNGSLEQRFTHAKSMPLPGYCSIQIISSILSILSAEGTTNVTKVVLYNIRANGASLSDEHLSFPASLVYAASGGPAIYHSNEDTEDTEYTQMSAGCMLIIRLLQLLFIPDMSASVLNVLSGVLSSDKVVDTSLLALIESSFRELPIDREVVNRILLIYETVAFNLSKKILEAASGPGTFQALERLFDYFSVFIKQLKLFYKFGANPEIVQKSLSLICMSIFTHYSIVTGRLLPAFEKAINAIISTIDPVNEESFFEKVGIGFSGIAEGCFLVKHNEQQEYEEVVAGLKGFFNALVAAARHTENRTSIFIITSFIKHLDLEMAFKAFDCGLISDDGHSRLSDLIKLPHGATDLWLLSYYSKCKKASISFIYTHLFEGILNQPAFKKLETGVRSILLDQLWTILSETTRSPVINDFLGYSQDNSIALAEAHTKASVDMFCSILIDNLFGSSEAEPRIFHACSSALGNLLRFFSNLHNDVTMVIESILKASPSSNPADIADKLASTGDICTLIMEFIAKQEFYQLSDTVVDSLRFFEAALSFVGGFLVPNILSPLLDRMLATDSSNTIYVTILPLAVSLAKKPLVSTVCTNVIKRIIAGTDSQANLFDVFNGILSGCITAKNFSPLGPQTVPVFLELDAKLSAIHTISAQKLHYKILRFLVNASSKGNQELIQAIVSSIESAGVETFRGGALQRHRFGLYADIVRSSDIFNLEPHSILSEFARDVYLCLGDNNMRVRHMASEMIKSATVKSCRQCCNDESLVSLKMNIYEAVQKLSDCLQPPQDSSFDVWANYAYLLQIIMIGMTEVVRKLIVEDLNILLEKGVNVSEFNCTHPLFVETANQILLAIKTNLSLEKKKIASTDIETGEELIEFSYHYTLSLPTLSARRLLNFFSAFISAAGPSELLSMAEEIPQVLLRLVIGSLTSPYRSVVKNILFQLGLAMGYSYAKQLYEEAFNTIIKDMIEYIIVHSETPIQNLDPEVLVAIREAAAEACISSRRMVSAVLSKLRHKASDQMIGRFTLPNYMDVALSIPEDMHGRIRSYNDDDVDFTDIYRRIVDANEEAVDLEETRHRSASSKEIDDPFKNNKKFGKSLNSAMAMLLDETVERDNLRPEHMQKIAQIKENDAILNRTLAEIKKINQRKQYSSGKLKVVHTGHEYSSKRAAGDVRDVNKVDPYAYLPLLTGKHISKQDRSRLKAGMALVTQKRTRDERIAKKQTLSHAEKRAMLKHGHVPPNLKNNKNNKKR